MQSLNKNGVSITQTPGEEKFAVRVAVVILIINLSPESP